MRNGDAVTERRLRQAIIDGCRAMNRAGINQGTSGNISMRSGETMLITPSGVPYDEMTPDMVATVRLSDGAATGPCAPSSEWHFHRALLAARPDIHAVVHAHPPHATALAMARRPLPAAHYMVAAFGGHDVRLADYALFGTPELSTAMLSAMKGRQACLMANHGATTGGETLSRALWRMEELETLCRQYILSLAAGGPHLLDEAEIDATLAKFADYGPRAT